MIIHVCPKCYEEGKLVQVKFIGNYGIVMWCDECQEAYYEEDSLVEAL
ncbi:hypothetical protein [Niallia endozanthoxylica]|nr:hypothetical protein [Niallia endozanthoxylica]